MIRKTVLTTIALLTLFCVRVQAAPIPEDVIKETIVKHSLEMNVDPELALSIAKKESGFRHEIRSSHGAVGVFQVLPSTAKKIGYNPYYLNENIKAGLTYYKMMYKMFGSTELALAAYNAGPGNVYKYGKTIPPYRETQRFVSQIMLEYNKQKVNPDPAIIKVRQAKAPMPDKDSEASNTPKELEIPNLSEIPEIKDPETIMEIL